MSPLSFSSDIETLLYVLSRCFNTGMQLENEAHKRELPLQRTNIISNIWCCVWLVKNFLHLDARFFMYSSWKVLYQKNPILCKQFCLHFVISPTQVDLYQLPSVHRLKSFWGFDPRRKLSKSADDAFFWVVGTDGNRWLFFFSEVLVGNWHFQFRSTRKECWQEGELCR
jgi:hypothetical protein